MGSPESERRTSDASPGELTKLERAVLDMLLAGDHPVLAALRRQQIECWVEKREYSGSGFFAELKVDPHTSPAPTRAQLRFGDVEALIPGLQHGAGFVLLVRNGFLELLEGYSYEEEWPTSITEFTLSYAGGARNVNRLRLDGP